MATTTTNIVRRRGIKPDSFKCLRFTSNIIKPLEQFCLIFYIKLANVYILCYNLDVMSKNNNKIQSKNALSAGVAGLVGGAAIELLRSRQALKIQAEAHTRALKAQEEVHERATMAMVQVHDKLSDENANLKKETTKDPLTGIPNRRGFTDYVEQTRAAAKRNGAPVGLLMIDIDHFKNVNDTHGHHIGDEVLKSVASIVEDNSRRKGIDFAARWGGEEFVVLLPGANEEQAQYVGEILRENIEDFRGAAGTPNVTASIGAGQLNLDVFDADGNYDLNTAMAPIDAALYLAKGRGQNADLPSRNRVITVSEEQSFTASAVPRLQ
jgi:diguanylate cyclase (GGDEF)-like protein